MTRNQLDMLQVDADLALLRRTPMNLPAEVVRDLVQTLRTAGDEESALVRELRAEIQRLEDAYDALIDSPFTEKT